ncbi:DNA repair protein RAD14, putative [Plasmodium ovale]|uniref:DNA repair protein RAD14, putative n=2 Tax=Plasmodium ovale TaxID=36330 RepID=A0A1D3KYV0_PLAOA|nr:DNA repair protein RAD14, putative (RAD14) [Plasmodium ovale curtisi]SBS80424.1 DNA repair protein RAD14, putative (RAD14) [Plasmodium ovale curtisi]SCD22364.1 DNA repair protein RAD14, putative [Plasmodium ovale]
MTPSEDSPNELEEENYMNILYEKSPGDEIDYFDDKLPHINFYLKFQKRNFLQTFLRKVRKKEEKKGEERKHICIGEDKGDGRKDILVGGEADERNILNEGGFYLDADSTDECSHQKLELDKVYLGESIPSLENIGEVTHLEDNQKYTQILNSIFQANKDMFTFSIERMIGTKDAAGGGETYGDCVDNISNDDNGDGIILQEYCFLCNKRKKLNKVLISINIYVCYECKSTDSNFRMISLSRLINMYSLNMYDMQKYETKLALLYTKNPRGYSKKMKLYFLFQIKEIAIRKHGSLEKVKSLYNSKIVNVNSKNNSSVRKKNMHKLKKPKTIYSIRHMKILEKQKIICDDNEHDFDEPICTNRDDGVFTKKCKRCSYQIEFMHF